jgi:DNA-directed RNA polymerase subunit RPC12/RpoP
MPDIHFECPRCAQPIDAPLELANQLIDCPNCNEKIEVPRRSRPSWTVEVTNKPAPKPPEPRSARASEFRLPGSGVSIALTIVALLGFGVAVIGGLVVGFGEPYMNNGNPNVGWLVFGCGALSGLILLGFARVIEYSFQSAQRLQRIESLMQRSYDDKPAA